MRGRLTASLPEGMVFHMKTTLIIPDPLLRRLKREAARQRTTVSALVERALRLLLEEEEAPSRTLAPLPRFHGGRPRVDVANREALYEAMERG
jgi:Ribbon-helix-helix protein, copG family